MPSVVRDKEVATTEKNGQNGQGGATPARRFHSRTSVTRNLSRSQEAPSTELLGNSTYLTRFIRSMTDTLNENESNIEAYTATIEEKNSASADGGPRSRVCARETLRETPHRH